MKFSIKSLVRPAKKPAFAAEINSKFDAWINSPEFAEECRQAEEKERRAEERRLARDAKLAAEREERRRNPKSPIDAYHNHMDNCPYGWWEAKNVGP